MAGHYSIPIDFSSILQEKPEPLKKCSEVESIDQYLGLLLSTCPGEHKFDPEWGCKIWEQDFKLITARIKWETWCATVIAEMIKRYEYRLCNVKVEAKIMDIVKEEKLFSTSTIRKRLEILAGFIIKYTWGPFVSNNYRIWNKQILIRQAF